VGRMPRYRPRTLEGTFDPKTGALLAQVPVGPATLGVDLPGFSSQRIPIDVPPEGTQVIVPMSSPALLDVTVFSGGTPVALTEEWSRDIQVTDFEGAIVNLRGEMGWKYDNRIRFLLPDAKVHRLVFPEFNGFQDLEAVEVHLDALRPTELVLNLKRK